MDVVPTPGFVTERMVIFLARELEAGKARPEEDEKIEQRVFKLDEAERWIRAGKIRDAKSVAGILYYTRFVARGG
jgi:ADP-ribose pyrophosphatase